MSLRIGALGVRLPSAEEIESPAPRLGAPEEIRLMPVTPMPPRRASAATLEVPDGRALALLDATVARLADLDVLARALSPEMIATLGGRLDAVRGLAIGVREAIADREAVELARRAWVIA